MRASDWSFSAGAKSAMTEIQIRSTDKNTVFKKKKKKSKAQMLNSGKTVQGRGGDEDRGQ